MKLLVFYGIVAIVFCFLQMAFFNKANHMLTRTLPISLSVFSFLMCLSIYLIRINLIKSKNYYIQISVDEVEVMFMFYLKSFLQNYSKNPINDERTASNKTSVESAGEEDPPKSTR